MPLHPSTNRRSTRRAVTAAAASAALVLTAACGGDGDGDDSTAQSDQVTYLTGFGASPHDAFIFVADEKGYFDDAGIEVDISLGGGNKNYQTLLSGEGDFTYIDYTGMFINQGSGELEGGDFRALSSVHQSTLVAILAPESSDITSPEDLTGKKIGAFAGSPTELLLPAYAELAGWEYDQELIVQAGIADLFSLLASGEVDALSTFIIQSGVIAGIVQEPLVEFPFNRVLDDLLGTGLITTSELADENPDLVERFRDAALEGLRYTIEHPEEAIDILAERHPDAVENREGYVGQIEIMTPYITSGDEEQIGAMTEAHVVRCISVLESAGLIPPGSVEPEDILGDQTLLASDT